MSDSIYPWVGNLGGATGPLVRLAPFQAGATQAIAAGEILELSSGNMIPLDADQSMAGIIAVAMVDIVSGDKAGYYPVMVPRRDDVFEFELAAAGAATLPDALYYSSSTKLTLTPGSNIIGQVWEHDGMPREQKRLSKGHLLDNGTTVGSTTHVRMLFTEAASWFAAFQTGD